MKQSVGKTRLSSPTVSPLVFWRFLWLIQLADPIIFRPLKALTLANSQQSSLLRLAQAGISVYCPHTAVDAAPGGLNDWLADVITAVNNRAEV